MLSEIVQSVQKSTWKRNLRSCFWKKCRYKEIKISEITRNHWNPINVGTCSLVNWKVKESLREEIVVILMLFLKHFAPNIKVSILLFQHDREDGCFPLSLVSVLFCNIVGIETGHNMKRGSNQRNQPHGPTRLQASRKRKLSKVENLETGGSIRKAPKSRSINLFQNESQSTIPCGKHNIT